VADDRDFWLLLSRSITGVLASSKNNHLRFLWVDTIIPQVDWILWGKDIIPRTDPPRSDHPSACAIAFVVNGRSMEKYWVTMSLGPTAAEAFRRRDLPALIPEDSTDWLSIDRARKEILIEVIS